MRPLSTAPPSTFASIRFVLTDMDDTLTHQGKLAAETYTALARLQSSGIKVIPVTAAPAGWCDQMVRMWPIDAVIGENGGFYSAAGDEDFTRRFWADPSDLASIANRLKELKARVEAQAPWAKPASDQPFRLTTLAWQRPPNATSIEALTGAIRAAGATPTVNSMWVLAWWDGFDKLKATRRMMRELYGVDIDSELHTTAYVGDSENDGPMFEHFTHTFGVCTVVEHLSRLPKAPMWVTRGPGGQGFEEVAEAILAARARS